MRTWRSLSDLFRAIPDDLPYLVLRNYEGFSGGALLPAHADIDVLTADPARFLSLTGATSRMARDDRIHYRLTVAGAPVELDLRTPGDGYYDAPWARALLQNRRAHPGGFYVPDEDGYFYSLLYHALVQKRELTDEYRQRLQAMAAALRIEFPAEPAPLLNAYMRAHGYRYTLPANPRGIANFQTADRDLIRIDARRKIQRLIAAMKRGIRKRLKGGRS